MSQLNIHNIREAASHNNILSEIEAITKVAQLRAKNCSVNEELYIFCLNFG